MARARLPGGSAFALLIALTTSCEPYPLIATNVVVPPGSRADASQLHLAVASGRQATVAKSLEPAEFLEVHPSATGFEVLFATRIGRETFTYARIWLDANANGALDPGEPAGELSVEPFRATDTGRLGCGTNRNEAPPVLLTTNR